MNTICLPVNLITTSILVRMVANIPYRGDRYPALYHHKIILPVFELSAQLLLSIVCESYHVVYGSLFILNVIYISILYILYISMPEYIHPFYLGCQASLCISWCPYLVYFYRLYTLKSSCQVIGVHTFGFGRCFQTAKQLYKFTLPLGGHVRINSCSTSPHQHLARSAFFVVATLVVSPSLQCELKTDLSPKQQGV